MSFAFKRTWGPEPKYPNVLSFKPEDEKIYVLAGPCSVESKEQINLIAEHVAKYGATHLRGGVYRAGTYPGKNFGFVDFKLIEEFHAAANRNGLQNVVEILDYSNGIINDISFFADCFQVGCRQMQNYKLLRLLGGMNRPIFLKRNPGSTIDELLGAAEHILSEGCKELILIERGSATNANHVRWDLSISMIPAVKTITKIPILVDASHGTGRRDLVGPMTLAGIAAGADGCLIETHPNPELSLSDSDQAVSLEYCKNILQKVYQLKGTL